VGLKKSLLGHIAATVLLGHDETGRKATAQMKQNLRIVFDNLLPKWNYRAIPQDATVIH
jgi:hypothetical protein